MLIKNAVYKPIQINWESITFPLKEGTPISKSGNIANDEQAVGLITQTIAKKPLVGKTHILVGGDVSKVEADTAYGSAITDKAVRAMDGIRFYSADGTPAPTVAPYTLPKATTSAIGGVKKSANVAKAAGEAPTKAEFDALIDALIAAGIMVAGE